MADFVIREWELPPYPGDQAPPHVRYNSNEAFYVLDGEMEILLGDQRYRKTAGTLVIVPSGTRHTFANHGPGNLRVLVIMTPEVDELITALHRADTAQARDAIWARYNSAVVELPSTP